MVKIFKIAHAVEPFFGILVLFVLLAYTWKSPAKIRVVNRYILAYKSNPSADGAGFFFS